MAGKTQTELASSVAGALAGSPLFGGLSATILKRVTAAAAQIDLAVGTQLFARGDKSDALFVIVEGEIEVRAISEGGKEVRLAALGAGAVLGEMGILDGEPRSADALAARRTRLLRVPRAALIDALVAEPKALLALVAEIVGRLRRTNEALEDFSVLDLGGRLAQLLLLEAGRAQTVTISQSEMARRIDASREKTNRKLQQWRVAGLIEIDRAGVHVRQPDALRALIAARRQS